MSYANRHFSFFNYSNPLYPSLLEQASIVLWQIGPINTTHGVPPQGHLLGPSCDNKSRVFQLINETNMLGYYRISVVCIFRIISFEHSSLPYLQRNPFKNVGLTRPRCGNLYTLNNGISTRLLNPPHFSAK